MKYGLSDYLPRSMNRRPRQDLLYPQKPLPWCDMHQNRLRCWVGILAIIAVITCIMGSSYVAVQQVLRQSANDPQIQLAEDLTMQLSQGGSPLTLMPKTQVNIAQSLAPFYILYDESGNAVTSTGILDGSMPSLPAGVFETTRDRAQDTVTWQPRQDVRIAAVIEHVTPDKGFVLVGRSLREVEQREDDLLTVFLVAWTAAVASALIACWCLMEPTEHRTK